MRIEQCSWSPVHPQKRVLYKFGLILFDIEVDRSFSWVSISIFNNFFNKLDDFRYMFGDSRQIVGILNS